MSSESLMRLASYNIRTPCDKAPNDWDSRQPRVLAMLRRHEIVIAGLQEAKKIQIDGILTDPAWAYVGVGRDDGVEGGEYSCIIYHKDRFEVKESHTFWLSETPEIAGSRSWNTCCTRICTWARFLDKVTGKAFTYFNTHLDHRSKEAQLEGMRLILRRIREYAPTGPVILTGDFNVYPDTPVVAEANAQLRNAYLVTETPKIGPNYSFFGYRTPGPGVEMPNRDVIDYIFVNDGFRVKTLQICDESENGLYSSDHYPVVADLQVTVQ